MSGKEVETLLCVGGCRDGEWLSLPRGREIVSAVEPVHVSAARLTPESVIPTQPIKRCFYRRMPFYTGRTEVAVRAEESLSPDDVIRRLIMGYKIMTPSLPSRVRTPKQGEKP